MSKRVRDWTAPDVMVWLTKNMSKLNSAETLRVYVQMESINGDTMLGFNRSDCARFGLIKPNDFEKILKKLQSHDDKLEKEERKTLGKNRKKKGVWKTDKDSGLDDNSSLCEDQGLRTIHVNSDSPGSANTSGTGSFAPSVSGGSTHKTNSAMVQPATYEWEQQPGRPSIPEATYMAPEEVHRTSSGTFERFSYHGPQDSVNLQFAAIPTNRRAPLPPPRLCDLSNYVNLPRRNSQQTLPSEVTKPSEVFSRGLSETTPPPEKGYVNLDRCVSQPAVSVKKQSKSLPTSSLNVEKAGVEKFEGHGYVNIPRSPNQQIQPVSETVEWVRPLSFVADQSPNSYTVSCSRRRSYENIGRSGSESVVPAERSPLTATYVDPISILRHSIPRSSSLGNVPSGRPQGSVTFDSAVVVPSVGHYESTIRIDAPNNLIPDEDEGPSRPVPLYPPLPDPDFEDPEATYENFEPPAQDDADEWQTEQTYLNLEEAEADPEDIYENQEQESSTSDDESSDDEGNQQILAEIQRRLTLAMAGIPDKTKAVPSRPPIQPHASGPFGASSFARRPMESPLKAAPIAAKPATPSRDVTAPSRDVPLGPPAPPEKPKHSFRDKIPDKRMSVGASPALQPPPPAITRQNTTPALPTAPSTVAQTSGGMSVKERTAMLNNDTTNDYLVQSDAGGVSIKDRQSKLAGLFGGAPQPAVPQPTAPPSRGGGAPPPRPPPSTGSPASTEKKPLFGGRAVSPPAPTRNPPMPGAFPPQMPPKRPSPQLPTPGPGLPPPPPPLSCIPQSNPPPPVYIPSSTSSSNMSKGCYEDNEITFPPPPTQGRSPMLPPSGGFNPLKLGSTGAEGYNAAEEDDEGLYDLEPEGPDDIYNDGDEDCVPGHLPHVASRQTAEEILRNDPRPECFLVRDSTNNPEQYPHVISLKALGNSFEHTRLGSRQNGRLAIGTAKAGETTHANLAELIRYHTTTPLNLRGRNVLLRCPIQSQ